MKINADRDKQRIGEALHRSGTLRHIKGDLINAEKDYRQAITIGYINQATYSNLGAICQGSGRMEEAILLFEKAIEINPNYTIAHMNLGNIYRDLATSIRLLPPTQIPKARTWQPGCPHQSGQHLQRSWKP